MFASKDRFLTNAVAGGYSINNSLRFRASASAYLSRTMGTPTSTKTFTLSFWCKRGLLGTRQSLYTEAVVPTNNGILMYFTASDTLACQINVNGSAYVTQTTAVYRDPSSWYHIVYALDTTQATAANRAMWYINGQVATLQTANYPNQNDDPKVNASGYTTWIGVYNDVASFFLDGYVAELRMIDGQALTPSSFGQTDANGVWQPIKYTGTYGNNGFYLKFADNSGATATTIGKDSALLVSSNLRSSGTNIGGMTANGGLAGAFDGVVNAASASAVSPSAVSGYVTTNAVGKDWGVGVTKTIVAFTANSPTDAAFRGDAAAVGFKLQGSTDNFSSSVVDLYSGTTPSGTAASLSVSSGIDTSTAYRYHRFVINGNGTNNTFVGELGLYESGTNGWNNWTPNNISVTAGTTYDSMIDSPTNAASGTQPVGNYATLNPLTTSTTLSSANLNVSIPPVNTSAVSTIGVTSGKWYCEMIINSVSAGDYGVIGIGATNTTNWATGPSITWATSVASPTYVQSKGSWTFSSNTVTTTYAAGDVVGVALDLTSNTLAFYKNGTSQGSMTISVSGYVAFLIAYSSSTNTSTGSVNFGQRPFSYTPPSGYQALCTANLPTPTIANGAGYMAATTYTGTGATRTIANTVNSTSFKPDFVWIKSRSAATNHNLFDSVRGATKYINSNTQTAQTTDANTLTAFASNGFTLGSDASSAGVNVNAATYVGWQWLGSNTTVSNTSGTITSTVCVNTTSGISIITYTGNGTIGATIGHGLGVAPYMVINKQIASIAGSIVYHKYANASPATGGLFLESTNAFTTNSAYWNNTAPTSTLITLGQAGVMNNSGVAAVVYAFAPIAGYSAFGSYTGNGSTDGPFVYLGFRPRWVMVKRTDSTSDWYIWDTSRDTYNVETNTLLADTAGAETSATSIDDLANGFKCRSSTVVNASSGTYIYAAFAENPFNYSRAR